MNAQDEPLLTKMTYQVLERVPAVWLEEQLVKREISTAMGLSFSDVARRVASLVRMRLVERRKLNTIEPATEIRRVGK